MGKVIDGVTPLMRQYNAMKAKFPDAILLFRVGDFYETFGKDAVEASKILGITLTKRANGKDKDLELAGFPHHSIDTYLPKLIRAGKRCAICEQLEDPKTAKGIVKRGITEVVTPSLSYNDKTSDHSQNNFLAAIHSDKDEIGVAFLDIGTGEFFISQGKKQEIEKLLQTLAPKEVILQKQRLREFQEGFKKDFYTNTFEDWVFTKDFANDIILKHFGINSLKGFGIEEMELGIIASGACLHYLNETQHTELSHIQKISRIDNSNYVWLDKFTIANLELVHSPYSSGSTLINVLNRTKSNMGARRLQRWVLLPLIDKKEIEKRQDIVSYFIKDDILADRVGISLKKIGDLERLVAKAAYGKILPNEVVQLKNVLNEINEVKTLCKDIKELEKIEEVDICEDLIRNIARTLSEDAPNAISKGNVIAQGNSQELDELREIAYHGKDYLNKLQQRESEKTSIPSLKIGFNNVFGYYLEVTNAHKDKVPETWHRKQTLTNAERYITEELKEYETKIFGAESKILEIETLLYSKLVSEILPYITKLQKNAEIISQIDCLLSFAEIAVENNYVRPTINEEFSIKIVQGRHPVIEKMLPSGESYIANDMFLDKESQQIGIITGPNMSGKSAYLRQNALIVLMAQIGSFVPAKSADIGIVDKIFTRVGASDNISLGESTFMVEMNETASILNNLSNRSLVLLDEIGRGTSTYDGVSIAWSIASYIHDHPQFRAKVLFATHYHELIEMEGVYSRIFNLHVTIKEIGKQIIFLRKIAKGGSSQSFGIHVARLAGMPRQVLQEAEEILENLEKKQKSNKQKTISQSKQKKLKDSYQLSFIQLDDPLLLEIKEDILSTDIDNLTPMEALLKLHSIKKLIEKV
ncbi:MAG: DNA mismatch repair protein MutS [Bacteroidales bacterium]|jgi:DNA mismatch repair protein MutS|nr:DNA mismatch repair protein MutS [Bacteroidales bacterium]